MVDIRGIIFDLDGVIASTAEMHFQSWKQLADEENLTFTRADNENLRGKTREVGLRIFTEGLQLDSATRQAWFERKNRYFLEKLEAMTPDDVLPGVVPLIRAAQVHKLKLGIGSSSKNALRVLERLKLSPLFDAIGDGWTVAHSKPAPDIFLWVAGALHTAPRHILVIEDSQAGVDAALRAGMYTVGVGNDALQNAHISAPGLANLTLERILAQLEHPARNA